MKASFKDFLEKNLDLIFRTNFFELILDFKFFSNIYQNKLL